MRNFERISSAIDFAQLQKSSVAIVGSAIALACDLAKSGVSKFVLVDYDRVDATNVARQDHDPDEINSLKIEAAQRKIQRVNPDAQVICIGEDCTNKTEQEIDQLFGDVDLLVLATDSFAAQAWGNRVALRLNIKALFIGLYRGGQAGEVIWWTPETDACLRCLVPKRYELHAAATAAGKSLDPPSDGATIHDIHFLDAIAAQIAVGLLTQGADNRYGRLIEQLGDRNFIQVKIAPDWTLNGRDVIREQLGVADDNDALFAWNAIARRDPDGAQLPCPDCEEYRGHGFTEIHGMPTRVKPREDGPTETVTDQESPNEADVSTI